MDLNDEDTSYLNSHWRPSLEVTNYVLIKALFILKLNNLKLLIKEYFSQLKV